MIKEETTHDYCSVIEGCHGLGPFSEVINIHHDVLMVIRGGGFILHKFNGPFIERTNENNRVQRGG